MKIDLHISDTLKRSGHQMNQDLLRAFHEYCSGGRKPVPMNLLSAAAFSALVLANLNTDPKKRDLMIYLLQQPITDKTYRKLKMFKWAPVQAVLKAYSNLRTRDYTPTLPRLLEMQKERLEVLAPAWGALMPDKIYALSQFMSLPSDSLDPLLLPFSVEVQSAFAEYTGVTVNGKPKPIHHEYLRYFCASWGHRTGTPDTNSLDIHSGLHIFGHLLLQ